MTLVDVLHDAKPKIFRRMAWEALSAGDAVYTVGAEAVMVTGNNTSPFEGIAIDTVNASNWVAIAVPPTEVYANGSGTIAAGTYVTPTNYGYVEPWGGFGAGNEVVCGKCITANTANTSIVLIRLMEAFNVST